MNWYLWLSKTELDPKVKYEYGRAFSRRQLQEKDIIHFNHEFLQSMGIYVAKHRLQILKHAGKLKDDDRPRSSIILAITGTKSLFRKLINQRLTNPWWKRGVKVEKEEAVCNKIRRGVVKSGPLERIRGGNNRIKGAVMKSGPLERGENRSGSFGVSGPLDRKMQQKLMSTDWNLSPVIGPQCGTQRDSLVCQKSGSIKSEVGSGWSLSPKVDTRYKVKETMVDAEELPSV